MPIQVKLTDVIDALEMAMEEHAHYLDRRTGEIIVITSDDDAAAEEDEPISEYPEWQRESILKAREMLREPDQFLALPDQSDIHEYQIMEDFCLALDDQRAGQELHRLIKGSGAFRRFKNAMRELGVDDAWYKFKHRALERIAIEWLEENEIPYSRDETIDASGASA
jgi:hypothetical protein